MYSFDSRRREKLDLAMVAWPPSAAVPTDLFNGRHAWHVSLDSHHCDTPTDSAKFAIYKLDEFGKRPLKPLELDYHHIDHGGFGAFGHAIIARPKDFEPETGAFYEVVITGLTFKRAPIPEVTYQVLFYDPKEEQKFAPTVAAEDGAANAQGENPAPAAPTRPRPR
jgi:hypothetical protein